MQVYNVDGPWTARHGKLGPCKSTSRAYNAQGGGSVKVGLSDQEAIAVSSPDTYWKRPEALPMYNNGLYIVVAMATLALVLLLSLPHSIDLASTVGMEAWKQFTSMASGSRHLRIGGYEKDWKLELDIKIQ